MSLTGVWRSSDGGQFHVHDLGSEVIFYGHRTDQYGTVFRGARAGHLINGWYVDVPSGRRQLTGVLQLSTNDHDSMTVVGEPTGFTSRELTLQDPSPTVAPGARFPTLPARYQSRNGLN